MPSSFLYFLSYWFWPNPGNATYSNPKVQLLLGICFLMIIAALAVSYWRKRIVKNPMTRTLSSSWSLTLFSFGVAGLLFAVSRVEMIQFLAMRFLWVIWAALLALYIAFQVWQFRRRHYVVVKQQRVVDERDKYLPQRKVRR